MLLQYNSNHPQHASISGLKFISLKTLNHSCHWVSETIACMFKLNACIGLGWLIHAPSSELTIIITSLDLAYKIGTCDLISDYHVLSYRPPQQQPWIVPLLVFPSSAWLTVSNHCGNSLSTTTPSQPRRATRTGWIVTFHLPQPQHQEQCLVRLAVKKKMEDIAVYRGSPLELVG